jgi:hypothetical protein
MAEDAVALLVRRMLDCLRRSWVACEAQLIGRGGKSDVGGALDVGHGMANGAAHGDCRVDIFPRGLVVVTLETLRGINLVWERDGVLLQVGRRRRGRQQRDESNHDYGKKNGTVARLSERHGSPSAESKDFTSSHEGQSVNVS